MALIPVAVQAGQLTDPECRAIPSLVAAVVAMAGGMPVIPQFHPHEEVSYQYMILLCFHFFLRGFVGFFRVSVSVLPDSVFRIRIRDPGSGTFLLRYSRWKKFGSGINITDPQDWLILMPPHHCSSAKSPSLSVVINVPDP
jgi:hypothetical protein